MISYHNTAILQFDDGTTGNAGAGVTVTVRVSATNEKAKLFDLNETETVNPVITDSLGNYVFKINAGEYDIHINEGSTPTTSFYKVNIVDGYRTLNNSFNTIAARMWAGEAIKFACFGDSTTDGNNTTSWTANPVDGSGNAIGNSNHNLTAPNAWPIKLQDALQEMFKNNSIEVWNAGYSGRRVDDGWANSNYAQAVIDNAFYGVPDVVFIGFGLNDIQDAGSQIDNHLTQLRLLIERVISDGSVPVLLTTDAEYRNGTDSTRDQKEAKREIDAITKSLALEYEIELIDFGQALKDWVQNNTDGYSWAYEQDDGLHFGDNGHKFKASYVASKLFQDVVMFTGGTANINTWDSASSYIGSYSARYKFSNNKQGGNVVFSASAPTNTDVVELYVWNEAKNANLIYLGVDDEYYSSFTIKPSVNVKDYISLNTTSKDLISTGGINSDFRRSDEHFIHSKLKYGLNKITYRAGDSSTLFYGPFKIVDSISTIGENVLRDTGIIRRGYSASSGIHADPIGEMSEGINTVGVFDGETVSISFDAILPKEAGIILMAGQGFTGTQGAINDELQSAVLFFRGSDDTARIYAIKYNNLDQVVFSSALVTTSVLAWEKDAFSGRFEMSKSGTNQQIKIFDKFRGGSALVISNLSPANSVRWSGFCGGTFYNSDAAGVSASVQLTRMTINRDYESAKIDPDEIIEDTLLPLNNTWTGKNIFSSGYLACNADYLSASYSYGAVMGSSTSSNVAIFGLNTSGDTGIAATGLRISLTDLEWYDGTSNRTVYHSGNFDPLAINSATQTALNGKGGLTSTNTWSGLNTFSGGYIDCNADFGGTQTTHSAVIGTSQTSGVAIFGSRTTSGTGSASSGIRCSPGLFQWYDGVSTYTVYHSGNLPYATSGSVGGFRFTRVGSTLNLFSS